MFTFFKQEPPTREELLETLEELANFCADHYLAGVYHNKDIAYGPEDREQEPWIEKVAERDRIKHKISPLCVRLDDALEGQNDLTPSQRQQLHLILCNMQRAFPPHTVWKDPNPGGGIVYPIISDVRALPVLMLLLHYVTDPPIDFYLLILAIGSFGYIQYNLWSSPPPTIEFITQQVNDFIKSITLLDQTNFGDAPLSPLA